jgi:hypothetical protein
MIGIPRWIPQLLVFSAPALCATAQVVVVEVGHVATKHVDSALPLHPSQTLLDTVDPSSEIESIAIDPATGDLFVQLLSPGGLFQSFTTHVFRVSSGVVTPVALNTGFGINSRGTDMHLDPLTGLLVTQDQNPLPARLATVHPVTGLLGTYSDVGAPLFGTGTFGMGFSKGAGGSDVPLGDVVFVSDVASSGMHSVTFTGGGGTHTTHVTGAMLPGGGDDMVIQPNGDWIHVGDFSVGISCISPMPPHVVTPSGLDLATIFAGAGLPFVFGSRATGCDSTGDFYVSYSGGPGGSGIFRIDSAKTSATLVATIGMGQEGLQDMITGPSSAGVGNSLYFTVHDSASGGEELWELTLPECPLSECFLVIGEGPGLGVFTAGAHVWQTQVSAIREFHAVTMEDNPSFPASSIVSGSGKGTATPGGPSGPVPVKRLHAQVLMWNPQVFPQNPEQSTNGLTVTLWSNGRVSAQSYGGNDGMNVWLETSVRPDGTRWFRFPFSIDGFQ